MTRQFRRDDPAEVTVPTADPDRDGLANLLELALGTRPTRPDGRGAIRPRTVQADGRDFPALVFDRPVDRSFLNYTVEVSGDLQTWTSGSTVTSEPTVTASDVPGFETVTIQTRETLSESGPVFLRLRVD
ncbi:MAG: hypothetical protein GWO24_21135 [Akkermansiaceae bacterium]|nr:hypothetical protein [Akkermansiaceae bacterium]